VSGVTSSRHRYRRAFGITPGSAASRARSAPVQLRAARLPPPRDRDLVAQDQDLGGLPRSSRRDSRSHAASRVIRRKTNRRHMTGEHHGQSAGRATVLVRAVDEILGTHRDKPSTDTARATMRNISFKPTSRKSSRGRPRANPPPTATRGH
jgi:hypothetical protein